MVNLYLGGFRFEALALGDMSGKPRAQRSLSTLGPETAAAKTSSIKKIKQTPRVSKGFGLRVQGLGPEVANLEPYRP